jgi:alpha-L-fucosidase
MIRVQNDKPNLSLPESLENKNTKLAVYEIAEQLHSGNNIFKNSGLTEDGLEMKIPKTGKTNPEILNWISKHAEALLKPKKGFQKVIFQEMSTFQRQTDPLSFCGRNSDRTDCFKRY